MATMLNLPRSIRRNLLRRDRELQAAERRHEAAVEHCEGFGEIDRLARIRRRLGEQFAAEALAAMKANPIAAQIFALAELPSAEDIAAERPMETVDRLRAWLRATGGTA